MAAIPKIPIEILRKLCDIIGETSNGLSNTEISKMLADCQINDVAPTLNKRTRVYEALINKQNQDNCSNNILKFITTFVSPVSYIGNKNLHTERLGYINEVLLFAGLQIDERGTLLKATAAKTIDEAQERAGRLKKKLVDRAVHSDVIRFCNAELLQENYFHAVFESTKSVADKIREKTGLTLDGADLVDKAFGLGPTNTPKLAFNSLQTESEQSEHKGFANLLKGLFGMFRNVTAHVPKIKWTINEEDALDSLTMASLLHRKLDKCVPTGY